MHRYTEPLLFYVSIFENVIKYRPLAQAVHNSFQKVRMNRKHN